MHHATKVLLAAMLAAGGALAQEDLSARIRSALSRHRAQASSTIGVPAPETPSPVALGDVSQRLRAALSQLRAMPSGGPTTATAVRGTAGLSNLLAQVPGAEVYLRENGTVRLLRAPDLAPRPPRALQTSTTLTPVARALTFITEHRELFRLLTPGEELVASPPETDDLGHVRVVFQQSWQGLPVWPAPLSAHFDPARRLASVVGAYVPTPRLADASPELTGTDAIEQVRRRLPAGWVVESGLPELIIYAPLDGEARLAWKCDLTVGVARAWRVVVAADNGRVLHCEARVCQAGVAGRGTDLTGVQRELNVWQSGATYYLLDTSKPAFNPASDPVGDPRGVITILDARNQPPEALDGNLFHITSTAPTSWSIPAAVSASFNFSETYDYFSERHARNSLDGEGGNISAVVRAAFDNAFWNGGLSIMVFGNVQPYPASLDVVAHELSHGVTEHTAGLIYQNQSGALNEAFSDILGEMAEARSRGQNDWLVGSELGAPFRSLKDPGALQWQAGKPYPARMSQFVVLPNTDGGDHGGVHINSSIINHAFYLLAEGLPGAVGLRDAERIFYRTLTQRLQPQSQFIDARLGAIASAEELFGAGSAQVHATAEAFDAIELGAAPATPEPSPVPVVPGEDSNLHIYEVGGFFGSSYDLYRHERALGDGADGRQFTRNVKLTRPAVTGDGEIALWVTDDHDLSLAYSDDPASAEALGLEGTVHSVAISPDSHWAAMVFRDPATGEALDQISVIDLVGEQDKTFSLVAPIIDGAAVDHILYADAMAFTTDSRHLVYDALSRVRFAGGSAVAEWSIFSLEVASGTTTIVVPPIDGISTGNPAPGRAGIRYLALDAQAEADANSAVFVLDLFTGDVELVVNTEASLAYPAFTGDESALVYAAPDGSLFGSGYSLYRQPLTADRLHPVGNPALYQSDARLGVVYRRGSFVGTNALPTVAATLSTNRLTLPGTVVLTATATDADGSIRAVEFFDGATALGTAVPAGAGQFTRAWTDPTPGAHRITARATDNVGGSGDSAVLELTVLAGGTGPKIRVVAVTAGVLELEIQGAPGAYSLEQSADLRVWGSPRSITVGAGGLVTVQETMQGGTPGARFYRVRKP